MEDIVEVVTDVLKDALKDAFEDVGELAWALEVDESAVEFDVIWLDPPSLALSSLELVVVAWLVVVCMVKVDASEMLEDVVSVLKVDERDMLEKEFCDENTIELEMAWLDVSCLTLVTAEFFVVETSEVEVSVTVVEVKICHEELLELDVF